MSREDGLNFQSDRRGFVSAFQLQFAQEIGVRAFG